MSKWSHISGTVRVAPGGSGQHAKRFVLEEVLDHLPRVYGSEGDMSWQIVERQWANQSSNHDEFGQRTNLSDRGWWEVKADYTVVLEGYLRDATYEDTLRAFVKWLNRLSKRVEVVDMIVRVSGDKKDSWGKHGSRIFSGAGFWGDNYLHFMREGFRERTDIRRSSNWRYGIVPDLSFWPDILIDLLPGGNKLAHDMDLALGVCEPEEYLEWNKELDCYDAVDEASYKIVKDIVQRSSDTLLELSLEKIRYASYE